MFGIFAHQFDLKAANEEVARLQAAAERKPSAPCPRCKDAHEKVQEILLATMEKTKKVFGVPRK